MSAHEWCQDVPRDEAVRAAEDAAAVPSIQHRDLPEQVSLLWASVGDLLGRVVRLEGEMDAGQAEAEEAAPAGDPAFPGEGFRAERVTLEIVQRGTQAYTPIRSWPWDEILEDWAIDRRGESVRVVEADAVTDEARPTTLRERTPGEAAAYAEGMAATVAADLIRERDAAREEVARLRARVAELETERAANAGGVAKQEPVAWGVLSAGEITQVSLLQWRDSSVSWSQRSGGTVVPLYAAPPEPRGWLTAEERACVEELLPYTFSGAQAKTLTALLARSSPPRVKVPPMFNAKERNAVIAAIREAGGEVEG